MKISKGLIIADPWIGFILDGSKTWEMRSSATSHRGWFGLIRKGTGAVHGVARLIDVGAPLSPAEMLATIDGHLIPEDMIRSGEVTKWDTPWKLADVRRLVQPVPYRQRSGAVTWVELDPEVSEAIAGQIAGPAVSNSLVAEPTRVAPNASHEMAAPLTPENGRNGVLIGQVELTQGNIDNSHIYLRSFFDRFPQDAVGGSNRHQKAAREISVDWGGSSPVNTDLDGSKRFFRARGWIRSFFEANGAEAGDQVLVEETGPYRYRVTFEKRA